MASTPTPTALHQVYRLLAGQGVSPLTDVQLLQRFAANCDEAAFAALVRRHGPLVWGVCRRVLKHTHDAEDAFQATFLVLARRAATVAWRGPLSGWLYGVAHRVAVRTRADAARRAQREARAAVRPPADPLAEVTGRDLCAALDDELQHLADKYRLPLVLCYLQGRTRDEAAAELGWSLGTLKRRLAQARERLRARLTRRGLSFPAALLSAALAQGAAAA